MVHKTVTVRMSEDMQEYVKSQGDDFTHGLKKIIEAHREGIVADIEAGVGWLSGLFTSVSFRDPKNDME